jgi:hypothetical protein
MRRSARSGRVCIEEIQAAHEFATPGDAIVSCTGVPIQQAGSGASGET